jgi:uncharacterized protein DUF4154
MKNVQETLRFFNITPCKVPRHTIHRKAIFALLFIICSVSGELSAQTSIDYAVHANVIYHFTKYIDWPENRKSGAFVVGIIGDSPLFDQLTDMVASKSVHGQRIVVKHVTPSEPLTDCHIIFISSEESSSIKKIAAKTAGQPVLVVGEDGGMASRGAAINFVIIADRLKLEINKQNIETHKLNIASELLQLGKIVK